MDIQEDLIYGFISTCVINLGHVAVASDYDDGDYQILGWRKITGDRKKKVLYDINGDGKQGSDGGDYKLEDI